VLRVGLYFQVFNSNPIDSITYFTLTSYIQIIRLEVAK
jgi:hypothetical protein